jgi:hypothetical protein
VTAVRVEFPYLKEDTDRHGNVRIYVRRGGCKIRIREPKGSAGFARAYAEARDALENPTPRKGAGRARAAPAGTLGALAADYFGSRRFKSLDPVSQTTRRGIIEDCLREPRKPGSTSLMANCPLEYVTAAVVMMLMDRKAGKPGAANNRKKYLSAMLGWAVRQRIMKANPARDAERASYATEGFHMHGGEFFEHGPRRQARRQRLQPQL